MHSVGFPARESAVGRDPLGADGRIFALGPIVIEEPPPLVFAPELIARRPTSSSASAAPRPASLSMRWAGRAFSTGASSRCRPLVHRRRADLRLRPPRQSGVHGGARRLPPRRCARRGDGRPCRSRRDRRPSHRRRQKPRRCGLRHRRAGARPRRPRGGRPAGLCDGSVPELAAKARSGTVGLPVVCGGVSVASGDIVVGDRDGVVVVPRALIAPTLESLGRVKAFEAATLERVKAGLKDLPVDVPALRRGQGVTRACWADFQSEARGKGL